MLYNLYRPTDFSEVKGQEDVLVTMKRQAQTGRFGHAYLLAGHRGTGKNDHCAYPVKSHQLRKPYRKRTLQGMPKLPCSQKQHGHQRIGRRNQ